MDSRGASDQGGPDKRFYRRYMGALVVAFLAGSVGFLARITEHGLARALFAFLVFGGPTFLVGWLITFLVGLLAQFSTHRARRTPLRQSMAGDSGSESRSVGVNSGGNGIFISYRRQDEPNFAGRLADRLSNLFGKDNVFIDVDSIGIGVNFVTAVEYSLSQCKVLLAIIGKEWLGVADVGGRHRLDDPGDYVRMEIATAFSRRIPVVPILVEGALMPEPSTLPESLVPLATLNAIEMSHVRFNNDFARLVDTLRTIVTRDV
jgi:hypothetical protein